jgi:PAS domain S-box-containing protein
MTVYYRHSEDEYRAILKTTLDGFWIVDVRGRFLDVNDAACRMLGYERMELLAMFIPDVDAVERPEDTRAHIEKVLATGFDRFESRHRRKDGTIVDVEVTTNYLPAGDGRLIVFVRDITAQKQAALALVESEARFRSIFENTSAGVALADASGNVVNFNAAFRQLMGYPADYLRGMNFVEFSHPDDMQRELPPGWPVQIPPPAASQIPPGRTCGL